MPQQREQGQTNGAEETRQEETARVAPQTDAQVDDLDALLDDIESTLETNAEEYVNRFVQKGGE
ncbi:ubiquitin-like protein Pup [Bifidobacterium avesanii]|uniref:Prokaryotic ubiquitin-like protein Pup n=1 Tax=Bifidobacterium avesanii TaxID=1798157 RepID=A0A7K3TFF0_9BIFI|nr:ubiquitin-like protein Pup [Bifidobacterium avesanii]KAB8295632.1 Prokaryotic ubiquitin-like protein Pup [Bifidobacterium avesanii]NEG77636.1 ubiquitin-like protein Pup [Bifidobacterium avesanii]